MSKIAELASGQITKSDAITIVLPNRRDANERHHSLASQVDRSRSEAHRTPLLMLR
jgi:hypothetical protein